MVKDVAGGPNHVTSEVVISIDSKGGEPVDQAIVRRQDFPPERKDESFESPERSDVENVIRKAESDLLSLVVNNVHGNNQVDTRINLLIGLNRPLLDLVGVQKLGTGSNEARGGVSLGNASIPADRVGGSSTGSLAPNAIPAQPAAITVQPTLPELISTLQGLQPQAPEIQTDIQELQGLIQQPSFR